MFSHCVPCPHRSMSPWASVDGEDKRLGLYTEDSGKGDTPGENDTLKPGKSSHDGQKSASLFRVNEFRAFGYMLLFVLIPQLTDPVSFSETHCKSLDGGEPMRVPDTARVQHQGPLKHRASQKGPARTLSQCWLSPHLQGDSNPPSTSLKLARVYLVSSQLSSCISL